MKTRTSYLTLLFAILSLVFLLLLVFLRFAFPPYPLISYQDALDLLTPLVLIPIYWLLFKVAAGEDSSLSEEIVFLLFGIFWVQGQGHASFSKLSQQPYRNTRKKSSHRYQTNRYLPPGLFL